MTHLFVVSCCLKKTRLFTLYLVISLILLTALSATGAEEKSDKQKTLARWTPQVWLDYEKNGPVGNNLPDFSRAGYRMGTAPLPRIQSPVYNVTATEFGAIPDDGRDDSAAIQKAINLAEVEGGGVVFLPAGRYDLKVAPTTPSLRISASNIVLRGERLGKTQTTLHLHSPGPDRPVRRLGTAPADKVARSSGAAIAIIGSEKREFLTEYSADTKRGEQLVQVTDSVKLRGGQMVLIECTDPAIDKEKPSPEKADLVRQLTTPFSLTPDQTDTFGKAGQTVSWIVRIEKVIDKHTIKLTKPARFNQWLRYTPRIYSFEGVRETGVENISIVSDWPGGYRHHKPFVDAEGKIIRSAKEQDYLWNGIWMSNAVDSWVRDVTFTDLTQGAILSYCGDTTLTGLQFNGQEGHAGITLGRTNGILVTNADFYARLVHPVTLTMLSSGNVVTASQTHYEGRDEHSGTDAVLDFHGMFPFENLFDTLDGFYICPGGDMSVLPHAGVRNVFWNITAPAEISCYTGTSGDAATEFMRTYAYVQTSGKSASTMYEHLPQAFYVGIERRKHRPISIGSHAEDIKNEWFSLEGFNKPGLAIPSLYEAQCNLRKK